MARRKIVPEEEVSKPAMAEETTATDVDDEAPADLMPDSNAEESATSEAVPTETLLEGINGKVKSGGIQCITVPPQNFSLYVLLKNPNDIIKVDEVLGRLI